MVVLLGKSVLHLSSRHVAFNTISSSRGLHLVHSMQRSGVQLSCVALSPLKNNDVVLSPTTEDLIMARTYYQHHPSASQTFLAGRCALRHAITTTHDIDLPYIPRNCYGVPLVPLPASVSHKNDLAVGAALISSENFTNTTIGVDIEVSSRPYSSNQLNSFQSHILTSHEKRTLSAINPLSSSLLIFSIKEAVYKALYPHYQRYIGFKEVEVVLSDDRLSSGSAKICFVSDNKKYFRGEFEVYWEHFMKDYWLSIVKYIF